MQKDFFVKEGFIPGILNFDTVTSTNDVAAELNGKEELAEGTVILAHTQTAGKGVGDHMWLSQPGQNLTFSLILHPSFLAPERQFLLNMAVALGLYDLVSGLLPGSLVRLKWPNDLYVDDRKMAGILISNTIHGYEYSLAVVGIGLNVNQELFPTDLPNPVSLRLLTGKLYSTDEVLDSLLNCLSIRYAQLRTGYQQKILSDYHHCLRWIGDKRNFRFQGAVCAGIIRGVDEFGRLRVELADGVVQVFQHPEIDF